MMSGTSGRLPCSRHRRAIHQRKFAEEVRRIGRGYFVQSPYTHFAIESHTIAPGFVVLLRRSVQLRLRKWWPFYNHVPDFNLLTVRDMQQCFAESVFGLTKSIMAVLRIQQAITTHRNKTD
jgi:hypothetical protein